MKWLVCLTLVVSSMTIWVSTCSKLIFVVMLLPASRKITVGVYSLLSLPDGVSQKNLS